jgi:sensor histidine kinase YesM
MEIKNTRIIRLMVDSRHKILRHVVFLVGVFGIIFYSGQLTEYSGTYRYYRLFCVYIILIITFYVNMNILVPRYFFKNRYIIYLILLFLLVQICLFAMLFFLNGLLDPMHIGVHHYKNDGRQGVYESTIIIVAIIMLTTMIKLFQRWVHDNERITELNNITLAIEMSELRNQINPHFLFNMLNGIKALVRTDPEKAILVIMKLSEFLRYQLYENNEEKTSLKSEIIFLINFLDLEKLRRDNMSVDISPGKDDLSIFNGIYLPPNLFTIFVENAVKHSVNINGTGSYIKISIEIKENKLYFNCINSIDPGYTSSQEKNSGLGLANIKRRLALLYGDNHTLEINTIKNEYNVKLIISI